jgi:putative endonuclease
MLYVYPLGSESDPTRSYVGFTENLRQRLIDHNIGKSKYTLKYRPWKLITYLSFINGRRRSISNDP